MKTRSKSILIVLIITAVAVILFFIFYLLYPARTYYFYDIETKSPLSDVKVLANNYVNIPSIGHPAEIQTSNLALISDDNGAVLLENTLSWPSDVTFYKESYLYIKNTFDHTEGRIKKIFLTPDLYKDKYKLKKAYNYYKPLFDNLLHILNTEKKYTTRWQDDPTLYFLIEIEKYIDDTKPINKNYLLEVCQFIPVLEISNSKIYVGDRRNKILNTFKSICK